MLSEDRVTKLTELLCGGVDKRGSRSETKDVHGTESTKLVAPSI